MKSLLIAVLVLLSGCASVPRNAPSFSPAPQANTGDGLVYIYRLGAYPTLRTPTILVDGKKLFSPPEGSYTWAHLSAGKHRVTVNWSWDTGWPDLNFEIDVSDKEPTFLKLSSSFENLGTHFLAGSNAVHVSPQVAIGELQNCCKYIAPKSKF